MATAPTVLVRLRTHNPKRGQVLRKYNLSWRGVFYRFATGLGWYRVPEQLGKYLAGIPARTTTVPGSDGEDIESDFPRAFHVCKTTAEAESIDKAEKRKEILRAKPRSPHLMVTDLTEKPAADMMTDDLRKDVQEKRAEEKTGEFALEDEDDEDEDDLDEEDEEDLDEDEDEEDEEEDEEGPEPEIKAPPPAAAKPAAPVVKPSSSTSRATAPAKKDEKAKDEKPKK